MEKKEVRTFNFKLEKRDDGEGSKLKGHASVFNEEADIGFFREKVNPGAFTDSIKVDDIRALFNHDPNFVLGRNKAGTLKLSEDKDGLVVDIDTPDTQFARDLTISIERGDISQMSIGFQVQEESWELNDDDNKSDIRTLEKVRLFDVSPVTFPAFEGTDIAVRSRQVWEDAKAVKEKNEEVVEVGVKRCIKKRRLDLYEKTVKDKSKNEEVENG